MHIEDLIILAATRLQMNPFDSKLIYSFQDQIFRGNGLTEKQANIAIKILKRQKSKIDPIIGQDIDTFLENPSFRLSKRTVNLSKRLSVIENEVYGKAIKVEFPYNEQIVQLIREKRSTLHFAQWDKEEKAWILSLDERNLKLLVGIVNQHGFSFDQELENYFSKVKEIEDNFEKYVPMISFDGDSIVYKNISENVPKIQTNDPLLALFEGRKAGIHTWDDSVDAVIRKNGCEKVTLNFLNSAPDQSFEFYLEDHEFFEVSEVVKYLTPCIFVIPGGSELQKLELSLDLLKKVGIDNKEISVLFRLPKETGENFNNFIRSSELNNPITDQTKAIFISSKVPKTVIDANIKFNSVVNFNFYSIHYTIREFLKNHHNVIHVMEKKPQRSLNFAFV
jgi:hypothetical protein